ncbi:SLC13 family permease [Spirochaetota bacterium]
MKKPVAILIVTSAIFALGYFAGLENRQIISATIFSLFISSTLLFWRFRLAFAFLGIVGLFLSGVLDIKNLLEYANFDIILFLIGMMTAVGFLEKRHFFEYLINKLSKIGNNARKLMVIIMLLSGLFGALIDEVTSVLFMVSIMLQLVKKYKLNPIPFILMIVFATNIGSSATVVGNPIGVLIAFRGGLTFTDFLRWASPISMVALALCILISILYFSKDIKALDKLLSEKNDTNTAREIPRRDIITSYVYILFSMPILVFHTVIENIFHLQKNTMLLGAAFIAAGLALIIDRKNAKALFVKSVDWWTLIFFALFFASVGTLKYVGTIDVVGKWMINLAGGSDKLLFFIFTGATAALTPIVDNVLVAAVFIPVIKTVASLGYNDFPIWWGMLFSGCLFGNLTMVGSTANIVAVGMLEARGFEVSLKDWIKAGAIISIVTLAVAILLIYIQIPLMVK